MVIERCMLVFSVLRVKGIDVQFMGDLQAFRLVNSIEVQPPLLVGIRGLVLGEKEISVATIEYAKSGWYVKERLEKEGL
ncbi:MAG: hypothetical protein QXU18_01920 [Thermoplasmatales archaeon]